jgi:hypothetical protein
MSLLISGYDREVLVLSVNFLYLQIVDVRKNSKIFLTDSFSNLGIDSL